MLALSFSEGRALAQSRFEVSSSLALSQYYDDNLFSSPTEPEAEYISRLSPRLAIGRRSRRLQLHLRGGLDAEVFWKHPELNAVAAGRQAALDAEWRMSSRTAVSATAAYASAQTPGELNAFTGLQVGRLAASEFSTTELFSRRLGELTTVTLDHHFTRQEVAGYPDSDTHAITVGLERRLGPGDLGRAAYSVRRYAFGSEPIVAHVATLGWTGEISSRVHLELDAGPSVTGQTIGADVTAALRHRFGRGDAGLAYRRTQTTVLGEAGPVTAEGVTATINRRLGRLTVAVAPSFFRLRGQESEDTILRSGVEATWRLARRLSLAASHQLTLQRGGLGLARGRDADIVHNTFLVRLAATSVGQ